VEELRLALEFPRRQVGWTVRELVEQLETVRVKLSLERKNSEKSRNPLYAGNGRIEFAGTQRCQWR
jgi:hypothetical protein